MSKEGMPRIEQFRSGGAVIYTPHEPWPAKLPLREMHEQQLAEAKAAHVAGQMLTQQSFNPEVPVVVYAPDSPGKAVPAVDSRTI